MIGALKIQAFGQSDHMLVLVEKYDALIERIKENKRLSEIEKRAELKILRKSFEQEKEELRKNLY